MDLSFIRDDMSLLTQVEVWKDEYIKLYNKKETERNEWKIREEKGLSLIKQYQEENTKMEQTNKLGIELVSNLRKQIEKYQNSDINIAHNDNNNNNDDINQWKSRYLIEKRTSEYLRAECEDLQIEIEHLRIDENNENDDEKNEKLENMLKIVNEAWEEEVTSLIEEYVNKETNNDDDNNNNYNNYNDLKEEMKREFNKRKQQLLLKQSYSNSSRSHLNNDVIDYKSMYEETCKSKLDLLNKTSSEIQRLRNIIHDQSINLGKSINRVRRFDDLFDRVARYHGLTGENDDLFELIVDAQLKPSANIT